MPEISTTEIHLKNLLNHAAKLGAQQVLIDMGMLPATIKRGQAVKLYGRGDIDRWVKEGLLKPIQDGSNASVRFSLMELTGVALASNRHTYLEVHER